MSNLRKTKTWFLLPIQIGSKKMLIPYDRIAWYVPPQSLNFNKMMFVYNGESRRYYFTCNDSVSIGYTRYELHKLDFKI